MSSKKKNSIAFFLKRNKKMILGTILWSFIFLENRTMCKLCNWIEFNYRNNEERNSFQNEANSIIMCKNFCSIKKEALENKESTNYNCFVEYNNSGWLFSITSVCETFTCIVCLNCTTLSRYLIIHYCIVCPLII